MSWEDEYGHELSISSVFADEMIAVGSQGHAILVGATSEGHLLPVEEWEPRSPSSVVGWVVVCTCPQGPQTVLARWTRVAAVADEDLAAGALYAADEDAADPDVRDDVESLMHALWGAHRRPGMAAEELERAARDARRAQEALNDAVGTARAAGLSWADVGRAVGITRQSARERWGS